MQRARFAAALGLFGMVVMILTGCALPPAAAQSTQLTSTPEARQMVIKDQEDVYVAVANTNEPIRLSDWLAAGWTMGQALDAKEAVPHDCALTTGPSRLGLHDSATTIATAIPPSCDSDRCHWRMPCSCAASATVPRTTSRGRPRGPLSISASCQRSPPASAR